MITVISGIIGGIASSILTPLILIPILLEYGKVKDEKIICKTPKIFRIMMITGGIFFLILMVIPSTIERDTMTKNIVVIILLILNSLFALFFCVAAYVVNRYKIVLDIDKKKITVYKLSLLKREIDFSEIFKIEKEVLVKDKNGKTLFYHINLLVGGDLLESCLRVIIRNNQNKEPIDMKELRRLFAGHTYLTQTEKSKEIDKKQKSYLERLEKEIFSQKDNWVKQIFRFNYLCYFGESVDIFILYKKDQHLKDNIQNGIVEETKEKIIKLLDEIGYVKEFNDKIRFEFDSYENIKMDKKKKSYYFKIK